MPVFKTTQSIYNTPWDMEIEDDKSQHIPAHFLPNKVVWSEDRPMTVDDVRLWEQIYYKSGDIGVYAAWDPYGDLYMIVHNLFINTTFGVEIFYGTDAADEVWKRASDLGVNLSTNESTPP